MAEQQRSSKGNPASHRMSNQRLKGRRSECWARGQRRKEQRRLEQRRREQANKERRARGELTPWEVAKAKRRRVAASA